MAVATVLLGMVVAARPAVAGPERLALGASGGLTLAESSRGIPAPEALLGLQGRADWPLVPKLSLAAVAAVGTGSRGPPWGAGVDAVRVYAVDIDLGVDVRLGWEIARPSGSVVLFEAGPATLLRLRRVETALRGGERDVVVGTLGGVGLYAGLAGRYGSLDLGLGVRGFVGGVTELQVLFQIGAALFGPS